MPILNTKKIYLPDSYYHVYNRGVHQSDIYRQPKDYWRFRTIAQDCLEEFQTVKIKVFSLLENHFHLQIYQENERDIAAFMQQLSQRYVAFFNKKYHCSGRLFESCYKARLLKTQADIMQNKQYILNNPLDAGYQNWQHVGTRI